MLAIFLNTGRKDRYDIICAADAYNNQHSPTEPDNEISGGGMSFPSTSSTYTLVSIGYKRLSIEIMSIPDRFTRKQNEWESILVLWGYQKSA